MKLFNILLLGLIIFFYPKTKAQEYVQWESVLETITQKYQNTDSYFLNLKINQYKEPVAGKEELVESTEVSIAEEEAFYYTKNKMIEIIQQDERTILINHKEQSMLNIANKDYAQKLTQQYKNNNLIRVQMPERDKVIYARQKDNLLLLGYKVDNNPLLEKVEMVINLESQTLQQSEIYLSGSKAMLSKIELIYESFESPISLSTKLDLQPERYVNTNLVGKKVALAPYEQYQVVEF